jgi:hypothetical protein
MFLLSHSNSFREDSVSRGFSTGACIFFIFLCEKDPELAPLNPLLFIFLVKVGSNLFVNKCAFVISKLIDYYDYL